VRACWYAGAARSTPTGGQRRSADWLTGRTGGHGRAAAAPAHRRQTLPKVAAHDKHLAAKRRVGAAGGVARRAVGRHYGGLRGEARPGASGEVGNVWQILNTKQFHKLCAIMYTERISMFVLVQKQKTETNALQIRNNHLIRTKESIDQVQNELLFQRYRNRNIL
jgi:hypothetical protein